MYDYESLSLTTRDNERLQETMSDYESLSVTTRVYNRDY